MPLNFLFIVMFHLRNTEKHTKPWEYSDGCSDVISYCTDTLVSTSTQNNQVTHSKLQQELTIAFTGLDFFFLRDLNSKKHKISAIDLLRSLQPPCELVFIVAERCAFGSLLSFILDASGNRTPPNCLGKCCHHLIDVTSTEELL